MVVGLFSVEELAVNEAFSQSLRARLILDADSFDMVTPIRKIPEQHVWNEELT